MDPKKEVPTQPTAQNPNHENPSANLLASSLLQITPTPPQTLPTQQPIIPPENPKKTSKKLLLIPLFLILIILALTSVPLGLAYNNYKLITPPQPVQNAIDNFIAVTSLPKTPRIILTKTQDSMVNIKSANIENTFNVETNRNTSPVKSISITLSGPVDFKTQGTSNVSLDISGKIAMEGIELSGNGFLRKIKNNLYFKINEFPAGSLLPLGQIKNQWFFINVDELQGKKENNANKIFQDFQKVFQKFAQKSQDWTQKSQDNSAYNLKIKPPKDEINNLVFDLIDIASADSATNLEKNIQKDNLKAFTNKLQNFEINVKVDKKTYLVSEINLQTDLTIEAPATLKQSGNISLSPKSQIPINLRISSKFTKYNEPVIVEIPQGAKDLKETVGQILKSLPKDRQIPGISSINPQESTPQAKPKEQTGFKNMLDNTSPVLGTQNTNWDQILMRYIGWI